MDAWQTVFMVLQRSGAVAVWTALTSRQKRAGVFLTIFFILVLLSALNVDTPRPLYPHLRAQAGGGGWHISIADVPQYALVAVADNDVQNDVEGQKWVRRSALLEGTLRVNHMKQQFEFEWSKDVSHIKGSLLHDNRGMELSTLQYWREGKLYSCDDRTGTVYEIQTSEGASPRAVPRYIIADGDGNHNEGFRCEWAAVKGDYFVLGSTGKPWTVSGGTVLHKKPMWIKTISPLGTVNHIDWTEQYEKIKSAAKIKGDGYLIHECAIWSHLNQRWFFVPRHVSATVYKPGDESEHGSSILITADATFQTFNTFPLTMANPKMGVTDCKFIPNGKEKEIVLLKVVEEPAASGDGAGGERQRVLHSYASIISLTGEPLVEDVALPDGWKFEGLELRPVVHSEA